MTVTLIATGGTIASTRDSDGSVSASLSGRQLLAGLPDAISIASLTGGTALDRGSSSDPCELDLTQVDVIDLAVPGSWNFSSQLAATIADTARTALQNGSQGVVITHGTDVLEETAWLTELIARRSTSSGPIVFTAAMRHADEFGGDGPRNLADSLLLAADPGARDRGVLVCLNGEIHHARWVAKQHTTAVASFASPGRGPIGGFSGDGPVFRAPPPPPAPPSCQGDDGTTALGGNVAIVQSHWDADERLIPFLLDSGVAGLVVEGGGAGNINGNLADGVGEALARDVPVVVASRCPTGTVEPIYGGKGGFATLLARGAVGSSGLSAGKARLALQIALGAATSTSSDARQGSPSNMELAREFFRGLDLRA